MNESQTPPPPEPNPSSDPQTPPTRRDLRADPPSTPPAHDAPRQPSPDPSSAPPAYGVQQPAPDPSSIPPRPPAPTQTPVPPLPPEPVADPDFPPAREPVAAPEVLDEGTYTQLREPRGGLALDGTWHQISPKYVVSQFVQEIALLVIVAVAAIVVASLSGQWWPWLVGGVIAAATIFSLIILPRQAKALGYMLRGDDIVFRRGILWQRMIAVPYGRMQLIDITHGPLDRIFGISKLKMVTAAASTGVEVPGLATSAAEALRDTLIEVAETRRTGL